MRAPARAKDGTPGPAIPAEVKRAALARNGDRCAVPGCPNEIFLDYAHLRPHAAGGDREAAKLVRACGMHHGQLGRGILMLRGTAEAPVFVDLKGVVIGSGPVVGGPGAGGPEDTS